MDSVKHTSSPDAELSSSTSTERRSTGRIRLRNVADNHDEDVRQSEDPEQRASYQPPSFRVPDFIPSAGANTTKGSERDFAGGAATIKPSNQTWYEFFGLRPTGEDTSSPIFHEAQPPIELQHSLTDTGRLPRAASEGCVAVRLSARIIATPAQPPAKPSRDRHRLSSTFPRTEPKHNSLTLAQRPIWPGFEDSEYSLKRETEWRPKPQSPKTLYECLQRMQVSSDTAASTTDSDYVGDQQVSTRQDSLTRIATSPVSSNWHDRSILGATHTSAQQATLATTRPISSDDMAAGFQRISGDARKYPSSTHSRTENRPPMSNVLCRNGPQCRKFQEGYSNLGNLSNDADLQFTGTCNFNHDFSSISADPLGV